MYCLIKASADRSWNVSFGQQVVESPLKLEKWKQPRKLKILRKPYLIAALRKSNIAHDSADKTSNGGTRLPGYIGIWPIAHRLYYQIRLAWPRMQSVNRGGRFLSSCKPVRLLRLSGCTFYALSSQSKRSSRPGRGSNASRGSLFIAHSHPSALHSWTPSSRQSVPTEQQCKEHFLLSSASTATHDVHCSPPTAWGDISMTPP